MDRRTPLLILGLGNMLCGDDGLGPAVVECLAAEYAGAPGVEVLDGGTLGLSLLPLFEEAQRVILVDAVRVDAPPGSVVRLEGDDVGPIVATRLSPHQVGVADVLALARLRGRFPERLILLGAVPESLTQGVGLSPVVAGQVADLVVRVVGEAAAMGVPLRRRGGTIPAGGAAGRI